MLVNLTPATFRRRDLTSMPYAYQTGGVAETRCP
jgi:hypothetical protein